MAPTPDPSQLTFHKPAHLASAVSCRSFASIDAAEERPKKLRLTSLPAGGGGGITGAGAAPGAGAAGTGAGAGAAGSPAHWAILLSDSFTKAPLGAAITACRVCLRKIRALLLLTLPPVA